MVITSKDNEIVKSIKKLKEKKYRKDKFLVEGIKMVLEAIEQAKIEMIVVNEDFANSEEFSKIANDANIDVITVANHVFSDMTDVVTPQGILAVVTKPNSTAWTKGDKSELTNKTYEAGATNANEPNDVTPEKKAEQNEVIQLNDDYILALDGIQDPGNLGTIIRTADSAGIKNIIVSKDTVDAYSPKVVRSTMGGIFRVNIIEVENLAAVLGEYKANNYKIVTTELSAKTSIYDVDYHKSVVVIGNEANGVTHEVSEVADTKVLIPMRGRTESLNAAVAASIMIYEYVRQNYMKL